MFSKFENLVDWHIYNITKSKDKLKDYITVINDFMTHGHMTLAEANSLKKKITKALDAPKPTLYRHTKEYVRDALMDVDYVLANDLTKVELVEDNGEYGTFKIWLGNDKEYATIVHIEW